MIVLLLIIITCKYSLTAVSKLRVVREKSLTRFANCYSISCWGEMKVLISREQYFDMTCLKRHRWKMNQNNSWLLWKMRAILYKDFMVLKRHLWNINQTNSWIFLKMRASLFNNSSLLKRHLWNINQANSWFAWKICCKLISKGFLLFAIVLRSK